MVGCDCLHMFCLGICSILLVFSTPALPPSYLFYLLLFVFLSTDYVSVMGAGACGLMAGVRGFASNGVVHLGAG